MRSTVAALQGHHPTHHRESHGFGVFGGVASLTAPALTDPATVTDFVADFLEILADECLCWGADLIGHLKVHVGTPDGTVRASLVDPRSGPALVSNVTGNRFAAGELTVNAIVHGLADEVVAVATYAAAWYAAVACDLCVEWRETVPYPKEWD